MVALERVAFVGTYKAILELVADRFVFAATTASFDIPPQFPLTVAYTVLEEVIPAGEPAANNWNLFTEEKHSTPVFNMLKVPVPSPNTTSQFVKSPVTILSV